MKKYHKRNTVLLACAVFSFMLFVLAGVYVHIKNSKLPNIIFITIDALRPDHLSCYGYPRKTSPNIDNFAKEGVRFHNCFAVSHNTYGTSPAFLTGKYLMTVEVGQYFNDVLDKKYITLAEHLKRFGYYTAALLANKVPYRKGRGFEQGFDYFSADGGIAMDLTKTTINLLDKLKNNQPFFIWLHYIDPHAPYTKWNEYFSLFFQDTLSNEKNKKLMLLPEYLHKRYSEDKFGNYVSDNYIPRAVFNTDQYSCSYYVACYDSEIAYADYWLGELFKKLPPNCLVVISADHGESLGEHRQYFSHGTEIYDEELRIPLIIKYNKYFKGGKVINQPVSSVDIVPTILSRVKPFWYFFNKNKFDGIDLKLLAQNKKLSRKYVFSYRCGTYSIRDIDKSFKYILYANGEEKLYCLPDEDNNLLENDQSAEILTVKKVLRRDLFNWLAKRPLRADPNSYMINLDEATKEELRALGYLN